MITAEQIKQARALLNWSEANLAAWVGYDLATIVAFETGQRALSPEACASIKRTLEEAGVEFTNGHPPGVELRKTN